MGISGVAPLLAGEAAAGRAPRGRSVPPPTAGPFTSAFFNPALATWATFHCSGHTLLEYMQVYWLGPLTGKGRGVTWESPWAAGKARPGQWLGDCHAKHLWWTWVLGGQEGRTHACGAPSRTLSPGPRQGPLLQHPALAPRPHHTLHTLSGG